MQSVKLKSTATFDIEEFEAGHRQLSDLLVRVRQLLKQEQVSPRLVQLMDQFIYQASLHFSCEETLMAEIAYQGYEAHKKANDALIENCFRLDSRCLLSDPQGAAERLDQLDFLLQEQRKSQRLLIDFLNN